VLDTQYRRVALSEGNGRDTLRRATRDLLATATSRELSLAQQNNVTRALNDRITTTLRAATGQSLSSDPQLWWQWWQQENNVANQGEKQTRTIQQSAQVAVVDTSAVGQRVECFAAGTPVWTAMGLTAIEDVRIGDLVLSQNVDTGELALKPVLRTTVRPPEPLFDVQIGDETFQTTSGHLFWVSGRGWAKARELGSGLQVHGVNGGVSVVRAERQATMAATYNVAVEDFQTYFVGENCVLSHDVNEQRPTATVVPGLPGR